MRLAGWLARWTSSAGGNWLVTGDWWLGVGCWGQLAGEYWLEFSSWRQVAGGWWLGGKGLAGGLEVG